VRSSKGGGTIAPMERLTKLQGSHWKGTSELWLDPLGDQVTRSDCTISVQADGVRYTWSHEGTPHEGRLVLRVGGADFVDSFHSPDPMRCASVAGALGLVQVQGEYGPEADWRWRVGLSLRAPTGELLLQMTNVAPWGEEARATSTPGRAAEWAWGACTRSR
jgi:hypothetical protein